MDISTLKAGASNFWLSSFSVSGACFEDSIESTRALALAGGLPNGRGRPIAQGRAGGGVLTAPRGALPQSGNNLK